MRQPQTPAHPLPVAPPPKAARDEEFPESRAAPGPRIESLSAEAYRIPLPAPESDGTAEWSATTLVLVTARSGGETGLGYTYADAAAAGLIRELLADKVVGLDAFSPSAARMRLLGQVRNQGQGGLCAMALSAVDVALWDLKARLLGQPLARLLGMVRPAVRAYGSGGFTSQSIPQLEAQLAGWAEQGFWRVKMKVGRRPAEDLARVAAARRAIGSEVELFVDANGAYTRKQALWYAERFTDAGVRWFEEPVSSDDLDGLRVLRDHAPAGMDIAAGEYGYRPFDFLALLQAGAVDVLQADATRCGGITGFLQVASLCEAFGLPLSSHCAPALHVPLGCTRPPFIHLEYFADHARAEALLFEGAAKPHQGLLAPDLGRPGLGLTFKREEAQRYRVAEVR